MQHPLDNTYHGVTVQSEVTFALASGNVQAALQRITHLTTCAANPRARKFWSAVAQQINLQLN